ncbi:MAG: glycosyltransferase, partial [Stackebrandtia sp.]
VTLTRSDACDYRAVFGELLDVTRIPNALHTVDVPRADPAGKVIVAAGRLNRQKGFDRLIPAFALFVERHPDWSLRIFGDGPLHSDIACLIDHHGLGERVFLRGNSRALGTELAKASIFALSSRYEGFPMVVLESLSHGLPVVSFDCHGPGEVITDGHDGFLVPPGDIEVFAKSLSRLAEDERLRTDMGRAARDTSIQYGPGSVTPVWERFFAGLLE